MSEYFPESRANNNDSASSQSNLDVTEASREMKGGDTRSDATPPENEGETQYKLMVVDDDDNGCPHCQG